MQERVRALLKIQPALCRDQHRSRESLLFQAEYQLQALQTAGLSAQVQLARPSNRRQ
jgi:hypothetical protein